MARTVFAAPGWVFVVKHDEPGFASMRVNSGTALGGLDRRCTLLALMASKLQFDHETRASLGSTASRMRSDEDREQPRDRAHGRS